jgi:hypothetical protein
MYVFHYQFCLNNKTLEVVGFFYEVTVILISYVGMMFNASDLRFYPRLFNINENHSEWKNLK